MTYGFLQALFKRDLQKSCREEINFVAETKGSLSTLDLRPIEATKIECARKFFAEINKQYAPDHVKYDVVNSFDKLMEIVR